MGFIKMSVMSVMCNTRCPSAALRGTILVSEKMVKIYQNDLSRQISTWTFECMIWTAQKGYI